MSYTLDVYLRRALPAQQPPRLRAVRHVLPAPRRRSHHAPHRARAAVRAAPACDAPASCVSGSRSWPSACSTKSFSPIPSCRTRPRACTTPARFPAPLDAWVGTLAFSGQIFCDFAGYSTTAIGAALCLGFAIAGQLPLPLRGGRLLGFLETLAHHAVLVAARLSVHPARRQSARAGAAPTAPSWGRCCSGACGTGRTGRSSRGAACTDSICRPSAACARASPATAPGRLVFVALGLLT